MSEVCLLPGPSYSRGWGVVNPSLCKGFCVKNLLCVFFSLCKNNMSFDSDCRSGASPRAKPSAGTKKTWYCGHMTFDSRQLSFIIISIAIHPRHRHRHHHCRHHHHHHHFSCVLSLRLLPPYHHFWKTISVAFPYHQTCWTPYLMSKPLSFRHGRLTQASANISKLFHDISIYCWLYSLFLMVNRPYSFLDLLVYIPIQTCKIPYCMIEPYYNY